ncbi:MAG: hypothetical protein H7Z37_13995 [Pyrinomonadaceae bacterium]|nr:hypothetical protein [Pyrinomonadaceae bacterium]
MNFFQMRTLLVLILAAASLTGCSLVNKVRARNELDDGANAYKERKFPEAEIHFQRAMDLDPGQRLTELFLARTLHQQYLAQRENNDNKIKGEKAIELYKQILTVKPDDKASGDAVTNLVFNLKGAEARDEWLRQRASDANVPAEFRADAYTALASSQYTCANEITEADDVKKTVEQSENNAVYVFKKPANNDDYVKAKDCAAKGTELINQALALNQNSDSTWSYKASLLAQQARIAEMDNNKPEKERLMSESGQAKDKFLELSAEKAKKKAEEEERKKAEAEAKK